MKATCGSGLRSVSRLAGLCAALALSASALLASSASAKKPAPTPTNYIAMGDSISYGYSQQKFEENSPEEKPSAFEGGFVNLLGAKLGKTQKKANDALTTVNLSCPGEVSDGLIGENVALGGGGSKNWGTEPDDQPCGWFNTDHFPRHFEFGAESELEAAVAIIKGEVEPTKLGATSFVTMQIGSNDELAVVGACENVTYREAHSLGGLKECLATEAGEEGHYYSGGLFKHIITNIGDTIGVLRGAGYTGPIGVLGFYNPEGLILPGSDALQEAINGALEKTISENTFGAEVFYANPMKKFNPNNGKGKSEAKAICKYTEECNAHDKKVNLEAKEGHAVTEEEASKYPIGDIHPSPAGHKWFEKILYQAFTTKKSVK